MKEMLSQIEIKNLVFKLRDSMPSQKIKDCISKFLTKFSPGLVSLDLSGLMSIEDIDEEIDCENTLLVINELLMNFKFPLLEIISLKFEMSPSDLNDVLMILIKDELFPKLKCIKLD